MCRYVKIGSPELVLAESDAVASYRVWHVAHHVVEGRERAVRVVRVLLTEVAVDELVTVYTGLTWSATGTPVEGAGAGRDRAQGPVRPLPCGLWQSVQVRVTAAAPGPLPIAPFPHIVRAMVPSYACADVAGRDTALAVHPCP